MDPFGFVVVELNQGEGGGRFLDDDGGFQLCELGAEAAVDARAEDQASAG